MAKTNFDAIVIGGGHAGVEAVRAISANGFSCALITLDGTKIGAMSCNPAIGGVAKSHLVFEIDALGGLMGYAADLSGIQARRLNMNKGPAVRSTRVQCDKEKYKDFVGATIRSLPGVTVIESEAKSVMTAASEPNKVSGVRLKDGSELKSRVVVVTSGTFMGGIMFCGDRREVGGRIGDSASFGLSESISRLGHSTKRLKTGTPARLKASTIDFSKWEKQWGDPERRTFSWKRSHSKLPQLACYHGYTSDQTHEVIRKNFDRSPLYSGDIVGVGPRYCPSVEDKVRRFAERERHQVFLEPESLDSESIYPNGLSTSLPEDVQLDFLRTIVGLERVELLRPGYAVEYDVFNPCELDHGFRSKFCEGLYLAGQVNRTSGYEEAAGQGLWAGINASRYLRELEAIIPDRSRSYLETLVDDLITRGSEEPYRMFTSRSEFRLVLREDNAHERMFELGRENHLLSPEQIETHQQRLQEVSSIKEKVEEQRVRLDKDRVISLYEYLKRPEVTWEGLAAEFDSTGYSEEALEKVEIEAKYSGYLSKQQQEVEEFQKVQQMRLRPDFDYSSIPTLSNEVREKVSRLRPKTVRELSAISGVTPSAVLAIARTAVSRET